MVLHGLARMPAGVEPLLRDSRGLFHYQRAAAARFAGASSHSHALHQVIRRITLASAARAAADPAGRADNALDAARRRRAGRLLMMGGARPAARTASAQEAGNSNTAAADDGEWVSDNSDTGAAAPAAGRDFASTLLRIRARSEVRRRRGVAKPVRRGTAGQQSLAAAYARFQTDEPAIRRTVSEMGQGDADTILQMIRGGISVDVTDSAGRTPLHVACSCGNMEGVRLLLHMGAAANARDRIGNTPLTLAATGARADIVIALLEAGADPRMGGGLVSATAMVRARLRLLRTSIRQARQTEKTLGADDAQQIRERRMQSADVAHECVDIIRLLRHYAKNPREEPSNPAYDASVATGPDAEPATGLLGTEGDSLDELAAQLTALGLDARPRRDSPVPPPPPPLPGKGNALDAPPSESPSQDDNDDAKDDQIDNLLGRFARLLGDDDGDDSNKT
ncbi:hypothetical protein H4R19_000454 [Coemansia spiralis]|nr:hypothetical protein H4R19_000454 [Coemansia spiralis]